MRRGRLVERVMRAERRPYTLLTVLVAALFAVHVINAAVGAFSDAPLQLRPFTSVVGVTVDLWRRGIYAHDVVPLRSPSAPSTWFS